MRKHYSLSGSLSELPRFRSHPRTRAGRGFSLIELIGVLAVMGILASMTVPPILRQIRQAQTANEDANLNEVARAIVEGIKATGTIPNPNIVPFNPGGWADVAYNYTTLTDDLAPGGGSVPGTLHYVFPSETAFADTARRIYLDPAFLTYLDDLFGGGGGTFATPADGWPATTPVGNIGFPNQAIRLYIVSSSRPDFVLSCSANGPNMQVAGNNYGNPAGAPLIDQLSSWVKATDPATGFIKDPGAAVENWANNAHQYLHVKTIDLRPLFCRVELTDFASPINAAVTVAGGGVGAGYVSAAVVGSQLGYDFRFNTTIIGVYRGLATGNVGNVCGSTKQLITRPYVAPAAGNLNDPATTTEAPIAEFQLNLPSPPYWVITPPGLSGSGNSMTATSNTSAFYVIRGTSLSLYSNTAPPPAAPILTVQINSDSAFEYFNGSWTRLD